MVCLFCSKGSSILSKRVVCSVKKGLSVLSERCVSSFNKVCLFCQKGLSVLSKRFVYFAKEVCPFCQGGVSVLSKRFVCSVNKVRLFYCSCVFMWLYMCLLVSMMFLSISVMFLSSFCVLIFRMIVCYFLGDPVTKPPCLSSSVYVHSGCYVLMAVLRMDVFCKASSSRGKPSFDLNE